LLFLADGDGSARTLPVDVHRAAGSRLVKRDGEVFDRRGQAGNFHVHARQITRGAGVIRAPLARLFADDERPLILIGYGKIV